MTGNGLAWQLDGRHERRADEAIRRPPPASEPANSLEPATAWNHLQPAAHPSNYLGRYLRYKSLMGSQAHGRPSSAPVPDVARLLLYQVDPRLNSMLRLPDRKLPRSAYL